jgi:hypothetical protein
MLDIFSRGSLLKIPLFFPRSIILYHLRFRQSLSRSLKLERESIFECRGSQLLSQPGGTGFFFPKVIRFLDNLPPLHFTVKVSHLLCIFCYVSFFLTKGCGDSPSHSLSAAGCGLLPRDNERDARDRTC